MISPLEQLLEIVTNGKSKFDKVHFSSLQYIKVKSIEYRWRQRGG